MMEGVSRLATISAILFTCMLCLATPSYAEPPKVINGLIDLRDWDFENDGEIALSGGWEFCWNRHLDSHQLCEKSLPTLITTAEVPGFWNDIELSGESLPGIGIATYQLDVLIANRDRLALKLLSIGTAYRLIVDGELLLEVGMVGRTEANTRPAYAPQVISFVPKSNRVEIVLQVANFHHRGAGLWEVIKIGRPDTLYQLRESQLAKNLLLVGAILIMALYNLSTWYFRQESQSGLFLGLFCLFIGARILLVGERYINEVFPGLGWEFLARMEYALWMLSVPLFMSYLHSLFAKDISILILRTIWGLSLVFCILALVIPIRSATELVPAFQLITVCAILYGSVEIVLIIIRRREGSVLLGIGCLFLFLAALNDMFDAIYGFGGESKIHAGLFVFVLLQSLLVSISSSRALQTIEVQSSQLMKANLELKIQEKLRKAAEGESIALFRKVDQSEQLKALGVIANVVAVDLSSDNDSAVATRANAVLTDIVSLIKNDKPRRDPIDMCQLLNEFFEGDEYQQLLMRHPKLDIVTDIESTSAVILGSSPHIKTLLLGLIRYIAEVQPEDQVVIISGRHYKMEAQSLFQHELRAGEYYVLKFADEGQGIDPVDLVDIFDPTEQSNFYAGLSKRLRNLAAAWTILKDHDGAIDIYSVPGSTRLDLYFPMTSVSD